MTNLDRSQRKVVVIVSVEYLHSRETSTFAARIGPLGLTAYGSSQEEASGRVKRMFASAVETRRERRTLTSWLDRSELDWHWLDEYEGDVPIEDARLPGSKVPVEGVRRRYVSDSEASQNPAVWQPYGELGVAA